MGDSNIGAASHRLSPKCPERQCYLATYTRSGKTAIHHLTDTLIATEETIFCSQQNLNPIHDDSGAVLLVVTAIYHGSTSILGNKNNRTNGLVHHYYSVYHSFFCNVSVTVSLL